MLAINYLKNKQQMVAVAEKKPKASASKASTAKASDVQPVIVEEPPPAAASTINNSTLSFTVKSAICMLVPVTAAL